MAKLPDVHATIIGVIIGWCTALGYLFKKVYGFYKWLDEFYVQHETLWEDYQYREGLREKRIEINIKKKQKRIVKEHIEDGFSG